MGGSVTEKSTNYQKGKKGFFTVGVRFAKKPKKHVFFKLLSLGVAVVLATSLSGGCNKNTSGGKENDRGTKTIVIFAPTLIIKDDAERRSEIAGIIKDALGFNVDFVTPVLVGFEQKLGVMLSSGEQVDLIWTTGASSIAGMVSQNYLMPIDEYVHKSNVLNGDNYLARADIDYASFGGKLYCVPYKLSMTYIPLINKAWLDKLGLPIPGTFDELNAALRAFVDNSMGGSLTIGLTHNYPDPDQIASFFGYFGVSGLHVTRNENGERYHPILSEAGRMGLLWLQGLYKDGILEKEFPTVQEAGMRQRAANGNVGMAFDWPGASQVINKLAIEAGKQDEVNMVAMDMLSAIEGVRPVIPGGYAVSWLISSTCKDPDLAFELIEWMLTPEAVESLGMKEGYDWEYVDGRKELLDKAFAMVVPDSAQSPIANLTTEFTTEISIFEMELMSRYMAPYTIELEDAESLSMFRADLLKCIVGKMDVDDYLTSVKNQLLKFKFIDISEY